MFKVLVVGGGIAGVSTALWLRDLAVDFDWVDTTGTVGGVLHRVWAPILNYPGTPAPNGGPDVITALETHVSSVGMAPPEQRQVLHIDAEGLIVAFDDQSFCTYQAIVLATGTQPRNVPGIAETLQDAVRFSSYRLRQQLPVVGTRVLIIGGGDGAFEGALELASAGARVVIAHRSTVFRARKSFRDAVAALPSVTVKPLTTLRTLERGSERQFVATLDQRGVLETHDFDHCVVKVGVEPVVPTMTTDLQRDSHGYIVVDAHQQTSQPGVFAVGDACSPNVQSLVTASGHGAAAALRIVALRDGPQS